MRYVSKINRWAVWDGTDWRLDDQLAMNRAKRTAQKMQEEATDDLTVMKKQVQSIKDTKSKNYALAKLAHEGATLYSKWAATSGGVSRLHAMLETASSEPGVAAAWEGFDSDPAILNCSNGIIELLETGSGVKFRQKDRDRDFCLMGTRTPYDPEATSPNWTQYLETFFPSKDVLHWTQKLIGASLFGANADRLFVVGWGPSTSGKGMFVAAIQKALGDYCGPFPVSVLRDHLDERPRADLIQALPRRAVFADELSEASKLHADQIKRITGDTTIQARAPHASEAVERVPAFMPWIMCNEPPEIKGRDEAIDRRLAVVPFEVSMVAKDNPKFKRAFLRDKFLPSAVLAWAVEGWKNYVREGILQTEPVEVMITKEKLLGELSDVDAFIRDVCVVGRKSSEQSVKLYASYEVWAETNGIRGRDRMTGIQFGRALSNRGFSQKTQRRGRDVAKVRIGLGLNESWQRI